MVVLVAGVGGGGALEECGCVFALAALGHGLIVDDFGEWQARGDEGEGSFSLGVLG